MLALRASRGQRAAKLKAKFAKTGNLRGKRQSDTRRMGLRAQHAFIYAHLPRRDRVSGTGHLYRRQRQHRHRTGLIMASEKSGRPLFLGSYPITPATDILRTTRQAQRPRREGLPMEDEIAGVCSAIGASYAGHLAVTSTSGLRPRAQERSHRTGSDGRAPARGDRRAARRPIHRTPDEDRADRPLRRPSTAATASRRYACFPPYHRPTASIWLSRPHASQSNTRLP